MQTVSTSIMMRTENWNKRKDMLYRVIVLSRMNCSFDRAPISEVIDTDVGRLIIPYRNDCFERYI